MIRSGLVSITFRKLSVEEIIDLVVRGGLDGIEWGGDIHVPHGDLARAKEVGQLTLDAGLRVAAYGSYYRVGLDEPVPFEAVLKTAVQLGAPVIRVWAGNQGSETADDEYRQKVISESRRIGNLAAAENIVVAYEFHGGTLTDTNESALDLLNSVNHDNIKTYWQPIAHESHEYCLDGLRAIADRLTNIHAFTWTVSDGKVQRELLDVGQQVWMNYLQQAASLEGEHFALIEFVKDDLPENFLTDAETLKRWLTKLNIS